MARKFSALWAIVLALVLSVGVMFAPAGVADIGVTVSAASKKLSAPKGVKATTTENSITLSWNKVSGAVYYSVFRYDVSSKKWGQWDETYDTKMTIKYLEPNTTYYFCVAGVKNGKAGKKSASITAKTKSGLPTAPKAGYTGLATYKGEKYYFKEGKLATGLIDVGTGKMYFDPTTFKMMTGWQKAGSETYYFNSNGLMLKNGTFTLDKKNYTFDQNGKVVSIDLTLPNPSKYGWSIIKSEKNMYYAGPIYRYDPQEYKDYRKALEDYGFEVVYEKETRDADVYEQTVTDTKQYTLKYNGKVYGYYLEVRIFNNFYDSLSYYLAVEITA